MKRKTESAAFDLSHIEAFMRGDMNGFREVYARYRQRVLTYCLYFMPDRTLAEDAFQEVFTRIYTHRSQLRDPNALTTWIIMVTRTVCLNMLRTSKFKPEFVSLEEFDFEQKPSLASTDKQSLTSTPIDRDVIDDELLNALSRLPLIYRDAFLLCEFEGYTYEEIAVMTKTNSHNVQVRITRAKKMMRQLLMPSETYKSYGEQSTRKIGKRTSAQKTETEPEQVGALVATGI